MVDGLHWAEQTLLELLEDLLEHSDPVPALLVTMSRATDRDHERPVAGDGPSPHTVVDVEPLDEADCHALLTHAIGEHALPAPLRAHVVRLSGGIPLFIEQLLTMLVDEGRLVRGDSGWEITASIDELAIPPTTEAILAARIDALPAVERATLGPASVIGRAFGRRALEHLRDDGDLRDVLDSLVERQMVTGATSPDGADEHRFRHLLARDVVYDGLLKRSRSVLHRRFGDWLLTGSAAGRGVELEEIIGYHFERSFELGGEVGQAGEELAEVGRRASQHLGSAGQRAFARGDMPAAASLLERAARAVPGEEAQAARLLVLAGDARFEMGSFDVALSRYDQAEQKAGHVEDAAAVAQARLARATQRYLTGDGVGDDAALEVADEAAPVFQAVGSDADVARCWRLRAYVELTRCQWGAAERAAASTIAFARRAGDQALERRVQPALAFCSLYGPTPVPEALLACENLLVEVGDDRRARALIERSEAHLLALAGEVDRARALCAATRSGLLELGWNFDAALVSIDLGPIELMAGRPVEAERELRADYEALLALGEHNYLSTTAYLLAEAVRQQGRDDEALAIAQEASAITAEGDVFSQAGWRAVTLRVLSDRGELDRALQLADEALAIVTVTDALTAQGDAHLDLAEVLARRGDTDAARAMVEAALAAYDRKGHRVGQARARKFSEAVGSAR